MPSKPSAKGTGKAKRKASAKRVSEVKGRRSAKARTFKLSDGRLETEIGSAPLNFRDGSGRWQPIDTRLGTSVRGLTSGFLVGNDTNRFSSRFGTSTDRLARVLVDGRSVSMGIAGAKRSIAPRVSGSTVLYKGVWADTDLAYQVLPDSLRKLIVLRKAPAAGPTKDGPSYAFTVGLKGLTSRQRKDGSIGLYAKGSKTGPGSGALPIVEFPAPFMVDSKRAATPYGRNWSSKVTQSMTVDGDRLSVTLTPDRAWLTSKARKFPVMIDPTIRLQPDVDEAQDTFLHSGAPTSAFGSSWQMPLGTGQAGAVYRPMVRFDLSSVPAGVTLDAARLWLYFDVAHTDWDQTVTVEARRVTAPWQASTATWDGMNSKFAEAAGTNNVMDPFERNIWQSFETKAMVQSWVSGINPNYGFMLKAATEPQQRTGGPIYAASEDVVGEGLGFGEQVNAPKLVLVYGAPSVALDTPNIVHATGPELSWSAYTGTDLLEYQVHRSVKANFALTDATLVAPVPATTRTYTDTSARQDLTDPNAATDQRVYYQVGVKLKDGTVLPSQLVRVILPPPGRTVTYVPASADTTITTGEPDTTHDTLYDADTWVMAGDDKKTLRVGRGLFAF